MKYRLFGRDGLTDHEWKKLVDWGIPPLQKTDFGLPVTKSVAVKKKVLKRRVNTYTGCLEEVRSEKSGSNASAYTYENHYEYVDNAAGDPKLVNAGFDVGPLDGELFGAEAASLSRRRFEEKKYEDEAREDEENKQKSAQRSPLTTTRKLKERRRSDGIKKETQSSIGSIHGPLGQASKVNTSIQKLSGLR